MKRQEKGIRSTTEKMTIEMNAKETQQCINPPMEKEQTNQLFAFLAMVSRKDGTIFVDYTGTFPIRAINVMTTIFVLYDWTTNAILATPVKDVKEGSTISAFKNNVEYLSKRGFQPTFNIIDNIASKAIRT